jgi:NADH-quinone oxidoreductase subunit L
VNAAAHPAMQELAKIFHGPVGMATHALTTAPFWLAVAGVACVLHVHGQPGAACGHQDPRAAALHPAREQVLHGLVQRERAGPWRPRPGHWPVERRRPGLIDGALVNGSWKIVGLVAAVVRHFQSGYLYHYALTMILGVFVLMTYFVWR